MKADLPNVTSLDAVRKAARVAAARKAAGGTQAASSESRIRMQVWIALAAFAVAYLAYSLLAGIAHS